MVAAATPCATNPIYLENGEKRGEEERRGEEGYRGFAAKRMK